LLRCLAPWEGCERMNTCSIHPVLAKAQDQLVAVLDATTLQDLADESEAGRGVIE